MKIDVDQQLATLMRGVSEVIPKQSLRDKLLLSQKQQRPLRIKAGFDPTAPDMHLGHVVLLRKLRQFQDFGHHVDFLIGDFTAKIGDPTGRDQTRPQLTQDQIEDNAKTYKDQVFKFLKPGSTRIVFNSEWFNRLGSQKVLQLASCCTVAQMLARADFKKRFEAQNEISVIEFLYPLLQGYDSYHLQSDVELGGLDQTFNLLMGRQIQTVYEQEPQAVMMTPLLEGTDGVKKMSKSLNNYISINDTPKDVFGKVMSISDELMLRYYEVLTDVELTSLRQKHPKTAKMELAAILVEMIYSSEVALAERQAFDQIFKVGDLPEDMPVIQMNEGEALLDLLARAKVIPSKRDGSRLLKQGAISWNGQKLNDLQWQPKVGVIKVGKRRFLKIE